jgi:hypothetical protein
VEFLPASASSDIEVESIQQKGGVVSMIKKALVRVSLAGLTMCGVSTSTAMAQDSLFRSDIIGSNPQTIIAGVQSGGAPWTVERGSAVLNDEGKLRVTLRDLILPSVGSPGPVTSVSASLVCGGAGGAVMATTDPVPLSADGNADIDARITVPGSCFAPAVLVRAAAFNGNLLPQPGPWIAGTGFTALPNSAQHKDGDGN